MLAGYKNWRIPFTFKNYGCHLVCKEDNEIVTNVWIRKKTDLNLKSYVLGKQRKHTSVTKIMNAILKPNEWWTIFRQTYIYRFANNCKGKWVQNFSLFYVQMCLFKYLESVDIPTVKLNEGPKCLDN